MLNFLRKLRRNNMNGKYLKYALGEIFLVMIGILLALALNNWNEERKRDSYEMLLLNEIKTSLERDRYSIDSFYLTRLEIKEISSRRLKNMVGNKEPISNFLFLKLFYELKTDFLYTFDSGPYDALKSSGLDRLKSDSLRSLLIRSYDNLFPTFKQFIDDYNIFALEELKALEKDFIGDRMSKDSDGNWSITDRLLVKDILNHPSFISFLKIESGKAVNQRDRITVIISIVDELLTAVEAELNRNN